MSCYGAWVAGVVTCSIVISESGADVDRTDLASGRNAPEARGLISISEDTRPQMSGSPERQAVISIEATNGDSIRWYAQEVLGLHHDHPSWDDMERQLANSDAHRRMIESRVRRQ